MFDYYESIEIRRLAHNRVLGMCDLILQGKRHHVTQAYCTLLDIAKKSIIKDRETDNALLR